jgi:release factor glutamine methyltransferase
VNRGQALRAARRTLEQAGIEEAQLEGEVLLRHVLGIERAGLFAGLEGKMTRAEEDALRGLVERRARGEPSAYLTGHREFYGLDFLVNHNVLIPRPETELLVEKAISLAGGRRISAIADVGTGSGAVAVSLAVHLPGIAVYATDVSPAALEVAGENAGRHGVAGRVTLLQGHLLDPLPGPVDMIIANLPYVRRSDLTSGGEPLLALDGGADGLDLVRALCREAGNRLREGGHILMEVGLGQSRDVEGLLTVALPASRIEIDRDLAGIERVITARLTGQRGRC